MVTKNNKIPQHICVAKALDIFNNSSELKFFSIFSCVENISISHGKNGKYDKNKQGNHTMPEGNIISTKLNVTLLIT